MKAMTAVLLGAIALNAQTFTRGVGIYPGDPKEDFGPELVPETQTYRNLALRRAAYQSSSYDFNLTAQLVTDGIKATELPRWISVATSDRGILPKQEREHPLDHNIVSWVLVDGPPWWIEVDLEGKAAPELDAMEVTEGFGWGGGEILHGGTVVVSGSDDGRSWSELGRAEVPAPERSRRFGAPPTPVEVKFAAAAHYRMYRVAREGGSGKQWRLNELAFHDQGRRVEVGGPYDFTSAWRPAGSGDEWVYVDLGAECTFDRVVLDWIRRAAEGSIEVSDDANHWRTVAALPTSGGEVDDIKLAEAAKGRYVRARLYKAATPDGYLLSEMEVYGRGGPVPRAHAAAPAEGGGLNLAGGGWRLQRDSLVAAAGEAISRPGFDDRDWPVATVPATVLSSYYNDGALPDPNYGDNIAGISDSFFYADFWYRDEFTAPAASAGRREWLNFRGINWKADVYLNGTRLGEIDGGFLRGRFDVTGIVKPGETNAIAVRIRKNATPGSVKEKTWENPDLNGGALGADNPTYHATIGWDWIPTVRGRDIGIWSDVYLESSGPVTIESPFVETALPLPDASRADITVEATLRNSGDAPFRGVLKGSFGEARFEMPVSIDPGAAQTVKLDASNAPALRLEKPRLWWPAGYGEPYLYPVELRVEEADGAVSDAKSFQAGVRQFTYTGEGNEPLRIFINGRRFIARGGNWGFPEVNLRYRAREYDTAVRYHRDMNFTMIRDWVGQTGDDEFYDACDKYGIVVWQDFWLANPSDGPDPDDPQMFLKSAEDYLRKIRNHASIGLYCGRNEGLPPKEIDEGLRALVKKLAPGMRYIPSSSFGTVSGGGPYWAVAPKRYFEIRATPKLHSELGMPNIVTLDSLKQMMPEAARWPLGNVWGVHDFTRTGAQGARTWLAMIEKNYGGAKNAAEFTELSQFIDYDGYRAMFEAQSKNRMGLLLWMSHPCWPSMVWQTYDYYFEPTAGYFGAKKGSEPLHVQWNPVSNTVEVVNYSAGTVKGLTVEAEVLNMDGSRKWEKTATVDSTEDSVEAPIRLEFPAGLTPVHFIRLKLTRGKEVVSRNFYLRGLEETPAPAEAGRERGLNGPTLGYNLTAIRTLPKVQVKAKTHRRREGDRWALTTDLHNVSGAPALMVVVKAVREKSGDRILPAIYSDNYVALMPGEKRTVRTELEEADTRGEKPKIVVEGFNVE